MKPPSSSSTSRCSQNLASSSLSRPSNGRFFKVSKVGWMSLSGRPRRKLLKPCLESFKIFKDNFFKVGQGKSGPNILADQSGTPYFPLYWTSQPAVFVTIVRKDLEKWEDEFIAELETVPHLSCSKLICGIGFSIKYLKDMKKKLPQGAEEGTRVPAAVVPEAVPLSHLEKNTTTDPLIISEGSQVAATWSDEGRPAGEEILERPAKRVHLEEPEEPHDDRSIFGVGLVSRGIILGRSSSPSMRARSGSVVESVDQTMLAFLNGLFIKQLGVLDTLDAIQCLAGCSAILGRAAKAEFDPLADSLVQAEEEKQAWEKTCSESDHQLEILRKTISELQEELRRSTDHHSSAQAEWEVTRASLTTEVEDAKRSFLVGQEKISSLEFDLVHLQAENAAQKDHMKIMDATILQQRTVMVHQYEHGFNHALAQVKVLHPDLDLSGTDPYKEIVDGRIVDVPSSPSA
ncbi:hypothetical protein CR513_30004, partial [Mucuna pruriens]